MPENPQYPALIVRWLTPVYDLFVRFILRERRFKADLAGLANIRPGARVLDLGAGTGTLAIMIKQAQPAAQVTGLDADPGIVAIAGQKASRSGLNITFNLGNAAVMPYPDAVFDRVVSSLMFSLLSSAEKQQTLHEAYRVLRPGGYLYIADFGPPHTRWGRLTARRMRRFEPIAGNLEGRLPAMFLTAGFEDVEAVARYITLLGTLLILSGRKTV